MVQQSSPHDRRRMSVPLATPVVFLAAAPGACTLMRVEMGPGSPFMPEGATVSNLILFGAGASFGSDESQHVPPLGTDLFDALVGFSPATWGKVSQTEAADFRCDFEEGMKEYAESHSSDGTVDKLQLAMAGYFFTFLPTQSSLYLCLARRIQASNWNGALTSLNYERLLELSMHQVGLDVVPGKANSNAIELCLPHGCCHLFINLKVQGQIVLGSMNLKVDSDNPPKVIHDPVEFQQRICTDQLPPVMCYFEPGKDARCGLSFINGQRERFRALVGSASVVALVGVKVRPHDRHLWDPLAQTPARLVYCAGKTDALKFESWARSCGRNGDRAIHALWDAGFDDVCSAVGIKPSE